MILTSCDITALPAITRQFVSPRRPYRVRYGVVSRRPRPCAFSGEFCSSSSRRPTRNTPGCSRVASSQSLNLLFVAPRNRPAVAFSPAADAPRPCGPQSRCDRCASLQFCGAAQGEKQNFLRRQPRGRDYLRSASRAGILVGSSGA
jgi:hypothetical protein